MAEILPSRIVALRRDLAALVVFQEDVDQAFDLLDKAGLIVSEIARGTDVECRIARVHPPHSHIIARRIFDCPGIQPVPTSAERPDVCCGICPELAVGGFDCTCEGNPRCPKSGDSQPAEGSVPSPQHGGDEVKDA